MTFGSKLKKLRTDAGMTQGELAKALNISKTSLVRYELNKREPSFDAIKKIKNYFGTSIDEIMDDLQETQYIENGKENFHNILKHVSIKKVTRKLKHVSELDENTLYVLLSQFYAIVGNLNIESLDIIYLACQLSEHLKKIYFIKVGLLQEIDKSSGDWDIIPKENLTMDDINKAIKEIQVHQSKIHELIDKYISEIDFENFKCVFQDEMIEMTKIIPWDKEIFEAMEYLEKISE